MSTDEQLSLQEAWEWIDFHLTADDGLIAHLERGELMDPQQVACLERAFRRLQEEWKEQTVVPKQAVHFLWERLPFSRLNHCRLLYPERTNELGHLMNEVSRWIRYIFAPTNAEAKAVATITHHFMGASPSFVMQLQRGFIDLRVVEETMDMLDILNEIWREKPFIPKEIMASFLAVKALVWTVPGTYSQDVSIVERIGETLAHRIDECLQTPS